MPEYHGWTHRKKKDGGSDPVYPEDEWPSGSSSPVEWASFKSTTSWDDTITELDFTFQSSNYDGDTFDLSADDNITIGKGGVYTIGTHFHAVPVDGSGTVWSHLRLDYTRIAGPAVSGWHPWTINVAYTVFKSHITANDPLAPAGASLNFFQDVLDVDMDGDFTPPLEILVEGLEYWDGLAVANGGFDVRLIVVRLGDSIT